MLVFLQTNCLILQYIAPANHLILNYLDENAFRQNGMFAPHGAHGGF